MTGVRGPDGPNAPEPPEKSEKIQTKHTSSHDYSIKKGQDSETKVLKKTLVEPDTTTTSTKSHKIESSPEKLPIETEKKITHTESAIIEGSVKAIKEAQASAVEEGKQLSDPEILKISTLAQKILQKGGEGIVHIDDKDLAHPIVIDFKTKTFTILLNESGKIQKEGGEGRVESVIRVAHDAVTSPKPTAGHFVHKIAKEGYEMREDEIRLTKKYQGAHELTYNNQTVLAVEAFDGDLDLKIEDEALEDPNIGTGSVADYEKNLHIAGQLIGQVATMHQNGDTHLDLKEGNILVRKKPDDNYTVQIADFGMSNKNLVFYGTKEYTSPEALQHYSDDREEKHPFTLEEKAQDVYALGLVLYKLATRELPPWTYSIEECGEKNEEGIYSLNLEGVKAVIEEQSQVSDVIKGEKKYQTAEAGKLLDFIAEMLDPDPTKRPNINQCLEKIELLESHSN